jgi:hypothetical protein
MNASMGAFPLAVYNSLANQPGQPQGPGIPPGGFYAHSFIGYPPGTQFDVSFSYSGNFPFIRDPGRVYSRVDPTQVFEFRQELSPAGPPPVPPRTLPHSC